ncbi:class I SAM-dependent methyltransferase [Candidatus Bipolaricaulota bacterium]|nr:class I SAM-dependent methyltransferase [Candidatus Bipolaricaulota bacterium]
MSELYPDSHIEIDGIAARYYETFLNLVTVGKYGRFIDRAIGDMEIEPEDRILDLGAGSGYNARFMAEYIGEEGKILGLDISKEGINQFREKFNDKLNVKVENMRIDQPLPYESQFTKVLTSFVIHGLPHSAREKTLENAYRALQRGGRFYLLDYGEFELSDLPLYMRVPFRIAECEYAYDYIARDWKEILEQFGFEEVESNQYLGGFTRLMTAKKPGPG